MKFIDRMVADSRSVALNHTAGLSLPQQVQMALFSLFALTDAADSYKTICQLIVRRRFKALWDGLGLPYPADKNRAGYYCELDMMIWAEHAFGAGFAKFLKQNYEPVDILFLLLAPEHASGDHLKALARISRLVRDPATLESLRTAPPDLPCYPSAGR